MSRSSNALQDVKSLSPAQKVALGKNFLRELSDVILTPPNEIAKKLRTPLSEAQSVLKNVCKEFAGSSLCVENIQEAKEEKFTFGDAALDKATGGGIRTGMVWELAGESASGKTQLALQLCLLVQLRPILGGLSGSACYLSTHAQLATKRLNQLVNDHPLLSPSVCSLTDIHTVAAPTIELLIRTLTVTFPALLADLRNKPSRKPVKLVVIDSISALFHSSGKPSSTTLFERSRALSGLSLIIHEIAARHKIAFVIINEVTDIFGDHCPSDPEGTSKGDIVYRQQSKWFNSANSIAAECVKEACLGLVWANQLNTRIMLTRTNRRRYMDDPSHSAKKRHVEGGSVTLGLRQDIRESDDYIGQSIVLRRFTVVFSSVSAPDSVDFIITNAGVSAVYDENAGTIASNTEPSVSWDFTAIEAGQLIDALPHSEDAPETPLRATTDQTNQQFVNARMVSAVVEGPSSESGDDALLEVIPSTYPEVDEFDDEGRCWADIDELPENALPDIDFDGLERSQVKDVGSPQNIASFAADG